MGWGSSIRYWYLLMEQRHSRLMRYAKWPIAHRKVDRKACPLVRRAHQPYATAVTAQDTLDRSEAQAAPAGLGGKEWLKNMRAEGWIYPWPRVRNNQGGILTRCRRHDDH